MRFSEIAWGMEEDFGQSCARRRSLLGALEWLSKLTADSAVSIPLPIYWNGMPEIREIVCRGAPSFFCSGYHYRLS